MRATSSPPLSRPGQAQRCQPFLPRRSTGFTRFRAHSPACVVAFANGIWRVIASSSPMVCSPADTAFAPGVFSTSTPARVAASRSILSTPTPARETTRNCGPARKTSSVTFVSDGPRARRRHATSPATPGYRCHRHRRYRPSAQMLFALWGGSRRSPQSGDASQDSPRRSG